MDKQRVPDVYLRHKLLVWGGQSFHAHRAATDEANAPPTGGARGFQYPDRPWVSLHLCFKLFALSRQYIGPSNNCHLVTMGSNHSSDAASKSVFPANRACAWKMVNFLIRVESLVLLRLHWLGP